METYWPTLAYFFLFPFSSLFPLQWLSLTHLEPVSLTTVLAEIMLHYLVRHSHPGALGILEPQCQCLARYWTGHLPPCSHCFCLDYLSHGSSQANFWCRKCFQIHHPQHFLLDNSRLFWFRENSLPEFILSGGPLQTMLVAAVIFLKISIQLHHHVECLTSMLWSSLQCLKFVEQVSVTCFGQEISPV